MTAANQPQANRAESSAQPVFEIWTNYFEQISGQTQVLLDVTKQSCDPAALRREWFDALAQGFDRYLRTPAFLEAMRRNLEMLTQLKGTTEDTARYLSRVAGIPRINDISGLFERMRVGQEAILGRLDSIEERLRNQDDKRKNSQA